MKVLHEHTETGGLTAVFGGQSPQLSFFYSTSRATTRVS